MDSHSHRLCNSEASERVSDWYGAVWLLRHGIMNCRKAGDVIRAFKEEEAVDALALCGKAVVMDWGSWVTVYNVRCSDSEQSNRLRMNVRDGLNFRKNISLPTAGDILSHILQARLIETVTQLSLFTFCENKSAESVCNANLPLRCQLTNTILISASL